MAHSTFDIITFDCYGTLVDWENGIADAFGSANREEVLRAYAEIEPVVEQERYRRYRDVLNEVGSRVAARLGLTVREGFLPDSLPHWKAFPDTNNALERLRAAGLRLGLLTNCDDDLIAATIRNQFTVTFDLIVTAQQVRSYKPAPAHFTTARERIGNKRWLHAAQSNFHDIVPTNAMKIPNAWINRKHETPRPGGIPNHEFADMKSFADWLSTER